MIFVKTERGIAELAARTLPMQLRRVLIVVNGKYDSSDLATWSGVTDIAPVIEELLAGGFIAPIAGAVVTAEEAPSVAYSDAATVAAAERMANVSLSELQREVVHELNELLGPMAADIAIKIERTRTLREWEVTVLAAVEAVRMGRDAETARSFAERVARIRQRAL